MRRPLGLLATLAISACGAEPAPLPSPPSATPATGSPAAQLNDLDVRAPVPLVPQMALHQKENMRDHLMAVQQIVSALAQDDFESVERAGERLGSNETMRQTCSHMGAGAPGFAEQATSFHITADGIGVAARSRDKAAVLSSLSTTLAACTGCHASWKQELVDERTLAERTR